MINLIEKFWDSEVRQMLTLATGIYFDYYLSAIGIDEQPPVPKNRKEINTHKIQDGHFAHLFLRDFYIRSNRKEIRRVGIAITFT